MKILKSIYGIVVLCLVMIIAYSCCSNTTNDSTNNTTTKSITKKTTNTKYHFESIGRPVKLHYIERNGMKYMIASGLYGEAGVSICNLTLDSLQVEYYKQLLNQ